MSESELFSRLEKSSYDHALSIILTGEPYVTEERLNDLDELAGVIVSHDSDVYYDAKSDQYRFSYQPSDSSSTFYGLTLDCGGSKDEFLGLHKFASLYAGMTDQALKVGERPITTGLWKQYCRGGK